jgi:FkbM family methyltransferase
MSLRQGLHTYYGLFGVSGVLAVARARLARQARQVAISVPNISHPVYLRPRTSDISTFSQVMVQQEYACNLPRDPRVIIDAGANIGLTSIFYANKYPDATIVAVEPEASNFELLVKNASPYANIIALQAALWGEATRLQVIDPGLGHYGFQTQSSGNDSPGRHRHDVPGMTVDEIMRAKGLDFVDLLKVDIEGSEKEVFENSTKWLDRVGVIVIELHDRLKPGCSEAVFKVTEEFAHSRQNGETVFLSRDTCALDPGANPQPPHTRFSFAWAKE